MKNLKDILINVLVWFNAITLIVSLLVSKILVIIIIVNLFLEKYSTINLIYVLFCTVFVFYLTFFISTFIKVKYF